MPKCNMCKQREGVNKSNIDLWYCQPCTDSLDTMDNDELIYRLENEIERYKEVLRFYADEKHYEMAKMQGGLYFERLLDRGEKAREALEGS